MTEKTREPRPAPKGDGRPKGPQQKSLVPAGGNPALAQALRQLQELLTRFGTWVQGLFGKKPPPPPSEPVRQRPVSAPNQPPPMQPEEKAWFDRLGPEEQASYLALPQAQRKLVRSDDEGRRRLRSESRAQDGAEESTAQKSSRLVQEIFATFHYVPPQDPNRSLRDAAVQTVANVLRASGDNVAVAKTRTMLSLLERPEFTAGLLARVEQELAALPKPTRRGAPTYTEAFGGLRSSLLVHVEKLIYPDLSAEELVRELVDAVVESVDQQPRQRRANKVSRKIAFEGRHIRG